MGCGCGKRFTKPSELPTPPAVLEEIARRMGKDAQISGDEGSTQKAIEKTDK